MKRKVVIINSMIQGSYRLGGSTIKGESKLLYRSGVYTYNATTTPTPVIVVAHNDVGGVVVVIGLRHRNDVTDSSHTRPPSNLGPPVHQTSTILLINAIANWPGAKWPRDCQFTLSR